LLDFLKRKKPSVSVQVGVLADTQWHELFDEALERDGSPEMGRRERHWTTMQLLDSTHDLEGETAEAGVLFGLGSYLICAYRQLREPGFRGAGHHAIDSFTGFEYAHPADIQPESNPAIAKLAKEGVADFPYRDRTEEVLAPFPDVEFHEGWIPAVFDTLDDSARYRFVHIDVDLHDPTYDSFEYFYPRVVPGGIIVIDDYGFADWPGCKIATHAFCDKYGAHVIPLVYGNAAIIKRGP